MGLVSFVIESILYSLLFIEKKKKKNLLNRGGSKQDPICLIYTSYKGNRTLLVIGLKYMSIVVRKFYISFKSCHFNKKKKKKNCQALFYPIFIFCLEIECK